jgi:hypothetical protein
VESELFAALRGAASEVTKLKAELDDAKKTVAVPAVATALASAALEEVNVFSKHGRDLSAVVDLQAVTTKLVADFKELGCSALMEQVGAAEASVHRAASGPLMHEEAVKRDQVRKDVRAQLAKGVPIGKQMLEHMEKELRLLRAFPAGSGLDGAAEDVAPSALEAPCSRVRILLDETVALMGVIADQHMELNGAWRLAATGIPDQEALSAQELKLLRLKEALQKVNAELRTASVLLTERVTQAKRSVAKRLAARRGEVEALQVC